MEHGWNLVELAPGIIENDDDRASSPGLADERMHHPKSISNVKNEVYMLLLYRSELSTNTPPPRVSTRFV